MTIVVFWVIFTLLIGFLAERFDRNPLGYVFMSIFLSPLVVGILLLIIGRNGKHCPECHELIRVSANKCKHCGHLFPKKVKK